MKWDDSHGHRFTHDLFKFPGKFHPPIVENLLREFKPAAVADPMGGVGTVAVEAKAAGIPSISLDIDPLSTFFAQVKTTPISEATLREAWRDLRARIVQFSRPPSEIQRRQFVDLRGGDMRRTLLACGRADLAAHTHWFRKYVLVDYARVETAIFNGGLPNRSQRVRRFFQACLLSGVRRISNADPAPVSGVEVTRHMREKIEEGYPIDVFAEFERRVGLNIDRMAEYVAYLDENGGTATEARILQSNASQLGVAAGRFNRRIDLIVTSPPYCNAIEYWRRHRLEYLLGRFLSEEEIVQLTPSFVGTTVVGRGHQRRLPPPKLGPSGVDDVIASLASDGRIRKAWQLHNYFQSMAQNVGAMQAALRRGGHAVIIVGDSRTGGRDVPTAEAIATLAKEKGLTHVGTVDYPIRNRVMQYPTNGHDKIARESIVVLQR